MRSRARFGFGCIRRIVDPADGTKRAPACVTKLMSVHVTAVASFEYHDAPITALIRENFDFQFVHGALSPHLRHFNPAYEPMLLPTHERFLESGVTGIANCLHQKRPIVFAFGYVAAHRKHRAHTINTFRRYVFAKFDSNDVPLLHPSVSNFRAR